MTQRLLGPTRRRQDYDFPNMPIKSAIEYCAHKSPFSVNSSKADQNGPSGVWQTTGTCGEGHYIRGYCYKLLAKCFRQWKLFAINDYATFRWLFFYFSGIQVAKLAVTSSNKQATARYYRGVLLPATDRTQEKIVLLNRMSAFGTYVEEIFYLDEGNEPVHIICQQKALLESSTGHTGDHANTGAVGTGRNQAYPPQKSVLAHRFLANGSVDLMYFHEVCESISSGSSFAATPDYLNASLLDGELGIGKYYLPGARGRIPPETELGCTSMEMDRWVVSLHPKYKETAGILDAIHWKNGLPNRFCSDQGRYVLVLQRGNPIDVPIFDRLPLICVSGRQPILPKSPWQLFEEFRACREGQLHVETALSLPQLPRAPSARTCPSNF